MEWVRVLKDGEHTGWLPLAEATRLGYLPVAVEVEEPWKDAPYVLYHAEMARESGLLQGDVNAVQRELLRSSIHWRNQEKAKLEEARFENQLVIGNADMYERYRRHKLAEEAADIDGVEDRAPATFEEFQAAMAELGGDEDTDWDKEVLLDDVPGMNGHPGGRAGDVLGEDWDQLGEWQ